MKSREMCKLQNTRWKLDPVFLSSSLPSIPNPHEAIRAIFKNKLFLVLKCFLIVLRITLNYAASLLRSLPVCPSSPSTDPRHASSPAIWAAFRASAQAFLFPWNALPPNTHIAGSFPGFRSRLKCHLLRKFFPGINSQLATSLSLYHITLFCFLHST